MRQHGVDDLAERRSLGEIEVLNWRLLGPGKRMDRCAVGVGRRNRDQTVGSNDRGLEQRLIEPQIGVRVRNKEQKVAQAVGEIPSAVIHMVGFQTERDIRRGPGYRLKPFRKEQDRDCMRRRELSG